MFVLTKRRCSVQTDQSDHCVHGLPDTVKRREPDLHDAFVRSLIERLALFFGAGRGKGKRRVVKCRAGYEVRTFSGPGDLHADLWARLAKKNDQAVLSFEMKANSRTGARIQVTHDVRIEVMKLADVDILTEPFCPEPEVCPLSAPFTA